MWKGTPLPFFTPILYHQRSGSWSFLLPCYKSWHFYLISSLYAEAHFNDRLMGFFKVRKFAFISILPNPEVVHPSMLFSNLFYCIKSISFISPHSWPFLCFSRDTWEERQLGCYANKPFYGSLKGSINKNYVKRTKTRQELPRLSDSLWTCVYFPAQGDDRHMTVTHIFPLGYTP